MNGIKCSTNKWGTDHNTWSFWSFLALFEKKKLLLKMLISRHTLN